MTNKTHWRDVYKRAKVSKRRFYERLKMGRSVEDALLATMPRPKRANFPNMHSNPVTKLSVREAQIIDLIRSGMTNKEIAKHTGLSEKTTSTYKCRAVEKMTFIDPEKERCPTCARTYGETT